MTYAPWHAQSEPPRVIRLDGPEELRVSGVVPVVRWARLIKYSPILDENDTKRAYSAMQEAWPDWQKTYRASLTEHTGVPEESLHFIEPDIRWKRDGDTPMLDLPRVQARDVPEVLELRNCCALCIEEFSSKIWTRVGRPAIGTDDLAADQLRHVVQNFRAMATSCGEWFYREYRNLTKDVFAGFDVEEVGAFEITTVGLRVEGTFDHDAFDSWLFRYDDEGRERPNLENEPLCRFLQDAAGLDFHPRELTSLEPQAFWMSMPFAIELPNGELAARKVLYLARPRGNDAVQVVGIGIDDSREGDLAREVALKVSRFLASRV